MNNILYILLLILIPVITSGQSVYTFGGQPLTYGGRVLTAQSATFDLSDIDSIVVALIDDPATMTFVSGTDTISAWSDYLGGSVSATQTSASFQPFLTDSGVRFEAYSGNGAYDYLTMSYGSVINDISIYLVSNSESSADQYGIFLGRNGSDGFLFYKSFQAGIRIHAGIVLSGTEPVTNTFNTLLTSAVYNSAANDTLWINYDEYSKAGNAGNSGYNINNIGFDQPTNGNYKGVIRAIIIIPNIATATVGGRVISGEALRYEISNWLNNRYNLY